MILVTLGTQDKEFTRILKKIDELIEKKVIQEEVVVQAGYTKYESKNMKIFDYVSKEEMEEWIKKSSFVITHAGVGTIFDCLKQDKKVIAIPRLAKYNEHNNDHQVQIAEEFANEKRILTLYDVEDLEKVLKELKDFTPVKYKSNNENMIKLIDNYIKQNEKVGFFKKINLLFEKYREVLMYLIFGFLTTTISLIVYYSLVYTILSPNKALELQIANIFSWIAGVLFAYITNRIYVFKSQNQNKWKEFKNFLMSRITTLFMDMAIMFIGVTQLGGNDKIIKIVSQIVVIVSNYIFSKLFVFKNN